VPHARFPRASFCGLLYLRLYLLLLNNNALLLLLLLLLRLSAIAIDPN
jgi:hypothetical protein